MSLERGMRYDLRVADRFAQMLTLDEVPVALRLGIEHEHPSWDPTDVDRVHTALLTMLSGWEVDDQSAEVSGVAVTVSLAGVVDDE